MGSITGGSHENHDRSSFCSCVSLRLRSRTGRSDWTRDLRASWCWRVQHGAAVPAGAGRVSNGWADPNAEVHRLQRTALLRRRISAGAGDSGSAVTASVLSGTGVLFATLVGATRRILLPLSSRKAVVTAKRPALWRWALSNFKSTITFNAERD